MAARPLIVFVHGWGAAHPQWWGTTETSVRSHPRIRGAQVEFFNYASTKGANMGFVQRSKELLGAVKVEESLVELGQSLWSTIEYAFHKSRCDEIALFGHSFGGIVIADAIRCALAREADKIEADTNALGAIRRVALCASPIAGAGLADTYSAFLRVFGENRHVQSLRAGDSWRQEAVTSLVSFLQRRSAPPLTLFYARSDEIVQRREAFEAFESARIAVVPRALLGKHSDCIANIGPNVPERSENFEMLAEWLFPRPAPKRAVKSPRVLKSAAEDVAKATRSPTATQEPIRVRDRFDLLTQALDKAIGADPFLSWRTLRGSSDVTDQFVLRIFLQQLNYAASRIGPDALGSANLWVAHRAGGELHLRSEEREGFFITRQLITRSPGRISIRANNVYDDPGSFDYNSAGAKAFLLDQSVIVATDRTNYESNDDEAAGVTHVLGIPLYARHSFQLLAPDKAEGVPLAITADFRFMPDVDPAQRALLTSGGQRLTQLFRTFAVRWPENELRLR